MGERTCNQTGCGLLAKWEVFWPGRNPPPVYCDQHAQMAKQILSTMGIDVVIRPLAAGPAVAGVTT